ncbi:cadherin-like protein 26 [Bufo gargarizans]|uniref:cadherin-like protein 26 n=1 Tax=Bufo gargarizans TaxID=30331 RepID=UPI001CF43D01|nr:cadherin-like protein 26 [Bufo gargarizans]
MGQSRQKRDWIIDTFTLQEELPDPYPKLVGTVNLEAGSRLMYKLQGEGVDEEPKGLFHINEDTGSIYVHQKIDFEKKRLFQMKFNAINKSTMKVDTRLGIHLKILDINDNAPEFKNKTYYISVNESAVQGYTIFTMLAYDNDEENTPNSIVSYYLMSQTPTDPNVEFTIDKEKGFISFKGCLNYETNKNYKLVIEAQDNGVENQLKSTCEVQITVLDRNTHLPTLSLKTLHAKVPEQAVNVSILRFGINDKDTQFTSGWQAKFSIIDGDDDEHYTILTDQKTNEGVLMVIKALDYEKSTKSNLIFTVENEEPLYNCTVLKKPLTGLWVIDIPKAQAQPDKQKNEITVDVLDMNDAPIFKPQNILVTLEEHSIQPGTVLLTVQAKDPDIVASNKIKYFLENDTADWLSVNEDTGVITTKKQLDRESDYVTNSKYIVKVLAVDDGEPPMTGTATLIVNLKDINDNVPKLLNPYITTCEKEEEILLTTPIIDKDLKPYSGPFVINVLDKEPEKKSIKLVDGNDDILKVKKLKDAYQGNHTLLLEIYDLQGTASQETITVHVCDCLGGEACIKKIADPPTLGGGAIALLLLVPVLFILLCLLLCKIETKKVMVPVETEPLNSMIAYNEESEKLDCMATNVLNGAGTLADATTNDQEEIDAAFHRSGTRRLSTSALVIHNKAKVGHFNSIQNYPLRTQEGAVAGAGTLDRANRHRHSNYSLRIQEGAEGGAGAFNRANRRRHSSYHIGKRQNYVQRFNSLRIQQANGGHSDNFNSLQSKYSRTLETALVKENGGNHANYNSLQRKYSRTMETALTEVVATEGTIAIFVVTYGYLVSLRRCHKLKDALVSSRLAEDKATNWLTSKRPIGNYKSGNRSFCSYDLQKKFFTIGGIDDKKLHAQMNTHYIYKPHVYAEEGELSHASSLESISIPGSSVNPSSLQSFGSKFNILENICQDHMIWPMIELAKCDTFLAEAIANRNKTFQDTDLSGASSLSNQFLESNRKLRAELSAKTKLAKTPSYDDKPKVSKLKMRNPGATISR